MVLDSLSLLLKTIKLNHIKLPIFDIFFFFLQNWLFDMIQSGISIW